MRLPRPPWDSGCWIADFKGDAGGLNPGFLTGLFILSGLNPGFLTGLFILSGATQVLVFRSRFLKCVESGVNS